MSALFPAAPDAFGADELLRLRRETPAWGSYAHFAHGSASLPPQVLYDALDSWLEAERRWGVQRAAEHFAEPLLAVRDSVARVLGTQPRHIALLDCASRAWSVAFAAALAAHPRIRAISSFDEYGSNSLCLLAARQQRGLELRLIDARGDAAQLLQRLDEQLHDLAPGQTPLLSLSAVPTGHGAATALEGVAERIRAHDGLLFLDASHAVGQLPLAVEAIGCDVLVFPPRKWLRGQRDSACSISANAPWSAWPCPTGWTSAARNGVTPSPCRHGMTRGASNARSSTRGCAWRSRPVATTCCRPTSGASPGATASCANASPSSSTAGSAGRRWNKGRTPAR